MKGIKNCTKKYLKIIGGISIMIGGIVFLKYLKNKLNKSSKEKKEDLSYNYNNDEKDFVDNDVYTIEF